MPVETTVSRVQYATNGTTGPWSLPFYFLDSDDIRAVYADATGVETVLALNVDFTLTGEGDPNGGTATTMTAYGVGGTLTFRRVPDALQPEEFTDGDRFPAAAANRGLDRAIMVAQRLLEQIGRAIVVPESESSLSSLPSATLRAGRMLAFNDTTGAPERTNFTTTQVASAIAAAYAAGSTADAVTFIQAGLGAVSRSVQAKLRDVVDVLDFGAVGDGATDNTAAINNALATGKHVRVSGGTFRVNSTLTMAVAGTVLEIDGSATISFQSATTKGIDVTAANCAIVGSGRLLSPATFDGTNSRRTYAVVWVAGNGFQFSGVRLENIPRAGIHFEDCADWRVSNARLIGNFPQSTYTASGSTLTGHCGIDYNPPSEVSAPNPSGVVIGCRIESCVQGVIVGNYDSAAAETGVTISGNTFALCWDHAIYLQLGEGHAITGNTCLNCKFPIVTDGKAGTVVGNTLYATETVQENGQQVISVRDGEDCVIASNTLHGLGAAINVECTTGTVLRRVKVAGNVIRRTGAGLATYGIRLGFAAETCDDCDIIDNTISGGDFGASVGAIQVETKAGFTGQRNRVKNNQVHVTNECSNINAIRQIGLEVDGNTLSNTHNAGSAATIRMMFFTDCTNSRARDNTFWWTTGGSNVNVRGIQTGGTSAAIDFEGNRFFLTSGSLASADPIGFIGSGFNVTRNRPAGATALNGTFTWLSGTASHAVSNPNAHATHSRVFFQPLNNNAATAIATKGVKAVITAGTITFSTGDGTNIVGNSEFNYSLD